MYQYIYLSTSIIVILCQQFIDLCILLGCDYCDPVKGLSKLLRYNYYVLLLFEGVGPAKGLNLVRQYESIEKIMANNPKVRIHEYLLCFPSSLL